MRARPWAKPELNSCQYYVSEPKNMKNQWKDAFKKRQPMHLELGCGKGVSTCKMAHSEKNINFIAIDMISTVLAMARRNIAEEYGNDSIDNILLTAFDATRLNEIFGEYDKFERIYISFCNPWDKKARHEKRRLTHPRQLEIYKNILKQSGEIWFKTDNNALWEATLDYFFKCGFELKYTTKDLHASGFAPNYMTEHELRYTAENKKTMFAIASLRGAL